MAPIIMGGTDIITQPAQAAKLSILAWWAKKNVFLIIYRNKWTTCIRREHALKVNLPWYAAKDKQQIKVGPLAKCPATWRDNWIIFFFGSTKHKPQIGPAAKPSAAFDEVHARGEGVIDPKLARNLENGHLDGFVIGGKGDRYAESNENADKLEHICQRASVSDLSLFNQ